MSVCLFPGKFQPFHTGQLLVVKGMVKACARVIIPVCYCEDSGMEFSQDEVREMITAALLAENIMDAEIQFISDCDTDEEWVDKIIELAEGEQGISVWSGNQETLRLFTEAKIETKEISLVPGHDSGEILQMIQSGNTEWRSKVPSGAMDVVAKHLD